MKSLQSRFVVRRRTVALARAGSTTKQLLATAIALVGMVPIANNLRAAEPAQAPIPWSEISARAGADYKGDGLSITPTENGAVLQAIFQRLKGEATTEGLWLTSTVKGAGSDRFRVVATAVGRSTPVPAAGCVSGSQPTCANR